MLRDSLGVPLEPETPFIVDYDYQSEPVYSDEADSYFRYDGDLVLKEDWVKYSEEVFEVVTVSDLIEENERWG